MTELGPWVGVVAVVVLGLMYWLGVSLIDSYFKRKEQFVDNLYDKTKGSTDGKNE